MKNFKFILFGFALPFFCECSDKENLSVENEEIIVPSKKSIKGSVDTVALEFRLSIKYDNGNGMAISQWNTGDKMGVDFGGTGSFDLFTVQYTSNDGKTASFINEAGVPDSTCAITYATTPVATGSYSSYSISVPTAMAQVGKTTNHLSRYMHMYAIENQPINWYKESNGLTFKHLTSLIHFRILNDTDSDVKLTKIGIKSSSQGATFHSDATVSLSPAGAVVTPDASTSTADIALSLNDVVVAQGEIFAAYQVVLPVSGVKQIKYTLGWYDPELELDDENLSNFINVSSNFPNGFPAGKVCTFSFRLSRSKTASGNDSHIVAVLEDIVEE